MKARKPLETELLSEFIRWLELEHNISSQDIQTLIQKKKEERLVPVSIFSKKLSVLESVVKYLRENKEMKFSDMAIHLGRNQIPLSTTYRNAKKKSPKAFPTITPSENNIPLRIFLQKLSPLEAVVCFLRDEKTLKFTEIAMLLKRDPRTVWTAHNRAKKK